MAKERAARYASWDEFSRDLAEIYGAVERRSEEISDTRKFQVLKGLSFFRGFGDAELWEFLRFSDWRRFTPGRVLLEEDRKGESFFVLGAGEARVSKGGRLLGIVHAGEPFGEMPYIFEESRARTAQGAAGGTARGQRGPAPAHQSRLPARPRRAPGAGRQSSRQSLAPAVARVAPRLTVNTLPHSVGRVPIRASFTWRQAHSRPMPIRMVSTTM